MSKTLYTVVSKETNTTLTEPTFNRELARGNLQVLKNSGLDAIIKSTKIDLETSKRIR